MRTLKSKREIHRPRRWWWSNKVSIATNPGHENLLGNQCRLEGRPEACAEFLDRVEHAARPSEKCRGEFRSRGGWIRFGWSGATALVACTGWLLIGANASIASPTHTWRGASATSGYWTAASNWDANDVPEFTGAEVLVFPSAPRRQVTNDFLALPPAVAPSIAQIHLQGGGGYELWGNPLRLWSLESFDPAGSNSTVRLDLFATNSLYLMVIVWSNNASLTVAGDIVLTNGSPLGVEGLGDCVISGIIRGPAGIEKPTAYSTNSYGELSLSGLGANTYSGRTTIKQGMLRLDRYRLVGLSRPGTIAIPGDLVIGTGTEAVASVLVVLERSDQIADTSAVTINGSGQLDLNDNSDRIESLTLTGGSVTTGTGKLTVVSNITVLPANGPSIVAGKLVFDAATTHTLAPLPSARLEIPANISSETSLFVTSGGEVWLGGSNSLSQAVVANGTKLTVANPGALGRGVPAATNATRLVNATLELDHTSITNELLVADGATNSTLTALGACAWRGPMQNLNEAVLTLSTPTGSTLTIDGQLTGTSPYLKVGPGVVLLAGGETNHIEFRVSAGTLKLQQDPGQYAARYLAIGDTSGGPEADVAQWLASEQVYDDGMITVDPSGLLDLNGKTEKIGTLAGSGAIDLGSGSLTVSNRGGWCTFAGPIRGGRIGFAGGEITKDGVGRMTLSGNCTYWGKTYLNGGVLFINGTNANSDIEVSSGTILGGTGTVQSIRFPEAGGTLAPGTYEGGVTLVSQGRFVVQGVPAMTNGTLEVELTGLVPGAGYDQLVTDQAPVLSGLSRRSCSLKVLASFAPSVGSAFKILDNRSASPVSGTFASKPQGATFSAGGLLYQISYTGGDGNDIVLMRLAAPAVTNFLGAAVGGQMEFQAEGITGVSYVLQAAPHLNPPVPWSPIATNFADASGLVQFSDSDMPLNARRFYRVVSP